MPLKGTVTIKPFKVMEFQLILTLNKAILPNLLKIKQHNDWVPSGFIGQKPQDHGIGWWRPMDTAPCLAPTVLRPSAAAQQRILAYDSSLTENWMKLLTHIRKALEIQYNPSKSAVHEHPAPDKAWICITSLQPHVDCTSIYDGLLYKCLLLSFHQPE